MVSAWCRACRGTGLYAGLGERGGLAVVCKDCRGTGENQIVFRPFTGRQPRTDITQVVAVNPGVTLAPEDTGGGVSYRQWEQDPDSVRELGREAREHYCPAWWYQHAKHALKPEWEECQKTNSFPACPLFTEKEECWERFDLEQAAESQQEAAG